MTVLCLPADLIALNAALDLPPLLRPVCHGYQAGCLCERCIRRERRAESGPPALQPWETEREAA